MMKKIFWIALILVAQPNADAKTLLPADLNPGDTYQLVFVTSGTIMARDSEIRVYNDFVQAAADLAKIDMNSPLFGLDVTWKAIVSTLELNADVNAEVNGPVYNLQGQRVANDYNDMWDGSLINPISFNERGEHAGSQVWTGSWYDGKTQTYYVMGTQYAYEGLSLATNTEWSTMNKMPNGRYRPLYAMSSPLTVPVPVPAAIWLFGSGLGALFVLRRKGRKE
jgi:hypothetical protein